MRRAERIVGLTPTFSALFGQAKARTLLERALRSGQLAHAYLFRGPDGVGKRLFARALAAAVNCGQRRGLEACGQCPSCGKYASGSHPDFLVISPEKGSIKIDRIRELIQTLSYPPYESATRVVVLEDIHTMRQEAANCLLKTLEEPPPGNLLVLTAAESREVLTTIRSRCQMIPFFSLSQEETIAVIRREEPELAVDAAQLLARLTEGSPGQALAMHKGEIMETWRELADLLSDGGLDADRHAERILRMAETMAALKEDMVFLLGLLRLWLRDELFTVAGVEEKRNVDARDCRKGWSSSRLFDKLLAVERAERELARNCNRILVCEVLLFALLQGKEHSQGVCG